MSTRYCPVCNGAGFVRNAEHVTCPDCTGGGKMGDDLACPACSGRGTQGVDMHRVCVACHGTGLRIPDLSAE
jgi:DnaJ-class molecular chaperone